MCRPILLSDDSRNEKIRIYIEEIDQFVGEISAQIYIVLLLLFIYKFINNFTVSYTSKIFIIYFRFVFLIKSHFF